MGAKPGFRKHSRVAVASRPYRGLGGQSKPGRQRRQFFILPPRRPDLAAKRVQAAEAVGLSSRQLLGRAGNLAFDEAVGVEAKTLARLDNGSAVEFAFRGMDQGMRCEDFGEPRQ